MDGLSWNEREKILMHMMNQVDRLMKKKRSYGCAENYEMLMTPLKY